MSLDAMLAVVDRAIADESFRADLLADPSRALRGLELNRDERETLKGLAGSPYTASPRGLADVRKMVLASLAYEVP